MSRYKNNITLPESYNSQLEEKNILKFWYKQQIIQKIQNARREKNDGKLSFHSGPVFSTGFPHSGLILNGVVKDVFTRYGHQNNFIVDSRFGWDCHGIPVEHEIDKKLGFKSHRHVTQLGIARYNAECRELVQQHQANWENVYEKAGNWVDFRNEYSTLDPYYMESVWSVFKQLYDKGLVYKDTKVQPYSSACLTNLSNFEAELNCKEVVETGLTISVNIPNSKEKLLIWTTTPWELVSNSAICVNPKSVYVKIKKADSDDIYIVAKNSQKFVFGAAIGCTVLEEFLGETLRDLKYEPLFDRIPVTSDFCVLLNDNVRDDFGTGIMPLDEAIVESLKERGHVFNTEEVTYKKPYCWRSDTRLINKQLESWFIRVEVEEILKNNSTVNWFPANEKQNFTDWLKAHCKDWSVSRTRYWGTPIPLWSSPSGDEVICVGSIKDLKQLTGKTNITDLHRESVDWMVIPSRILGNPPLRRIAEVFDCWFESAAMPFHDKKTEFQADFIAEGIDQKHGWFYTMLVLSTALSQPAPFRNVFATGIVEEPDGSKVSKRKHNHNDPMRLIEKYGADSLRLYLMSSPLTECQNFTIREEGVARVAEVIIHPLYRIFSQCTSQLGCPSWVNYGYIVECYCRGNIIDEWIASQTESLLQFYHEEMKAYRLHTIVPRVIKLIQLIEDWYIPIRCSDSDSEPAAQHPTSIILFNVIYRLCLILAPFAPFFTEYIYQCHRRWIIQYLCKESIHDALLLRPNKEIIKKDIELRVSRMQTVVEIVRALRARHIVPNEYSISEVIVIHHNDDHLHDIQLVQEIIAKLINAHEVAISKNHPKFGATLQIDLTPNSSFHGNQRITTAMKDLSDKDIESFLAENQVKILEQSIPLEDILITYRISNELQPNYAVATKDGVIVVMKMNKGFFFYEEGTVKVIANCIRNLKKKANYYPSDLVTIYYSTKDECLQNVVTKHGGDLNKTTNCDLHFNDRNSKIKGGGDCIEETANIKGLSMKLHLFVKSS